MTFQRFDVAAALAKLRGNPAKPANSANPLGLKGTTREATAAKGANSAKALHDPRCGSASQPANGGDKAEINRFASANEWNTGGTERIAALDRERTTRDRQQKRGYDFDRTAPGHREFMDHIFQDFSHAVLLVERLCIPGERLAEAQQVCSQYAEMFDRCFASRDWWELRYSFTRFVQDMKRLAKPSEI
jgi:hypothetical protein